MSGTSQTGSISAGTATPLAAAPRMHICTSYSDFRTSLRLGKASAGRFGSLIIVALTPARWEAEAESSSANRARARRAALTLLTLAP